MFFECNDMLTHDRRFYQADSQEELNRLLDEVDRIARQLDLNEIPIEPRQSPRRWLEGQAGAYERAYQSVTRTN